MSEKCFPILSGRMTPPKWNQPERFSFFCPEKPDKQSHRVLLAAWCSSNLFSCVTWNSRLWLAAFHTFKIFGFPVHDFSFSFVVAFSTCLRTVDGRKWIAWCWPIVRQALCATYACSHHFTAWKINCWAQTTSKMCHFAVRLLVLSCEQHKTNIIFEFYVKFGAGKDFFHNFLSNLQKCVHASVGSAGTEQFRRNEGRMIKFGGHIRTRKDKLPPWCVQNPPSVEEYAWTKSMSN